MNHFNIHTELFKKWAGVRIIALSESEWNQNTVESGQIQNVTIVQSEFCSKIRAESVFSPVLLLMLNV